MTVEEVAPRPISPRRGTLPDVSYHPRLYHASRTLFCRMFRLMFDLRVEGLEHVPTSGPTLVAGNHRGFLDGPLIATFTPREARFLAKSELFSGPAAYLLGWYGQIPVDRGRPDREALRRGLAVLEAGGMLGVFPEGSRGKGTVETVQHGIAYFALRTPGCPIVPVACVGTEQALPVGSRVPRWRTPVDVVFGRPFTVDVPAQPRARSALAAAGEEIRIRLAAHVAAVHAERDADPRRARAGGRNR